jgi:hypothetical protein
MRKNNEEFVTQYENTMTAYELSQKALAYAKKRLTSEGMGYPMFNPLKPLEENHAELEAYCQRETAYINEFYRLHKPQEVIAPKEVNKRTHDWASSAYDR